MAYAERGSVLLAFGASVLKALRVAQSIFDFSIALISQRDFEIRSFFLTIDWYYFRENTNALRARWPFLSKVILKSILTNTFGQVLAYSAHTHAAYLARIQKRKVLKLLGWIVKTIFPSWLKSLECIVRKYEKREHRVHRSRHWITAILCNFLISQKLNSAIENSYLTAIQTRTVILFAYYKKILPSRIKQQLVFAC